MPTVSLPPPPQQLPTTQSTWQLFLNAMQTWATTIRGLLPSGASSVTFESGSLQYLDPVDGFMTGSPQFEVGTNLPNPSGIPGNALLLGSGSLTGPPTPGSCWIITDQAFDSNTPGNLLGITAGETQPTGTADGGMLWLIGGGSAGGRGGTLQLQGGTSANGPGGFAILQGGNSTNGVPGDAFIAAGENGTQGANVHLIMTLVNGSSGDVRIRCNSNVLIQFLQNGEIYLTSSGTGAGLAGQPLVSQGIGFPATWQTGFTGTITTAALTGGGTQGSLTFSSGILISQVQAT